jgi:hypothetical protein
MDAHCSNDTIAQDLDAEKKSAAPVIISKQAVRAEERFEIDCVVLRMASVARPQLHDDAQPEEPPGRAPIRPAA